MATTLDQLVVRLQADISGLKAGMSTAGNEVRKFDAQTERSLSNIQTSLRAAGIAATAFGVAFAAAGIAVGKAVFDAGIKMESLQSKMLAATGSAQASAASMAYVRAESERLGLQFSTTADGFASFSAAALRAGLTMQQVQQVFTGVSEAATALQLSPEKVGLVFQALSQMAAKGTVSMEELKQQLGESLPFAMSAAARAMGVTQERFIEMVEAGEVMARDFLPRFGAAINANLGDAVAKSSHSAQANLNRLDNAIFDLKTTAAEGQFMNAMADATARLRDVIADPALKAGLASIAQGIGEIAVVAAKVVAGLGLMAQKVRDFFADADARRSTMLAATREGTTATFDELAGSTRARKAIDEMVRRGPQTPKMDASGGLLAGSQQYQSSGGLLGAGFTSDLDNYTLGDRSAGGGKADAKAQKAREKEEAHRESLRRQVEALKISLADEAEAEVINGQQRLEQLKEALDAKAITEQEYRDLKVASEQETADRLAEIRDKAAADEVRQQQEVARSVLAIRKGAVDAGVGLLAVFAQKNKAAAIALLVVEKARGIAEALISSRVAAVKALAIYGPTPAGFAAASAATTFGYVQAGLIAATGLAQLAMGSGGGGGGTGGGQGGGVLGSGGPNEQIANAQVGVTRQVYLNLSSPDVGELFTKAQVRGLLEQINDALRDGSRLDVVVAR